MTGISFEVVERALAERVGPMALEHSRRVAQAAGELAAVYGVDEDDARLAGLLHDWSREAGGTELVDRARETGVEVTPIDEAVPYLLHAPVGAKDILQAFPSLSPPIVNAVARHTVGATEMTDLDRVVYLADMIEGDRDFPGVDELRAAVGVAPLEELFAQAYATSLRHIIDGRRHLHPSTVAVWNAVVARDR